MASNLPIALSFSERDEKKQVLLVEFENAQLVNIQPLFMPVTRRLVRFKGSLDKIKSDLSAFIPNKDELPTWVEFEVLTDTYISHLDEEIKPYLPANFVPINIKQSRKNKINNLTTNASIDNRVEDMTPEKVFLQRCAFEKISFSDEVLETFGQLIREMNELGEL